MPPSNTVDDDAYTAPGDIEAIGDFLLGHSAARIHLADRQDVRFGELGHAMPHALGVSAVTDLVGFVLPMSYPAKVARSIIEAIAIPMRHLMELRRTRSMEHGADEGMDIKAGTPSQKQAVVSYPSKPGLEHLASPKLSPAIGCDDPPIQRPHAPKARHLIAGMTRHRTPLFDFCYRVLSHVAPPKRCGQGLTTGGHLSSVPQFSGASALQQAWSLA